MTGLRADTVMCLPVSNVSATGSWASGRDRSGAGRTPDARSHWPRAGRRPPRTSPPPWRGSSGPPSAWPIATCTRRAARQEREHGALTAAHPIPPGRGTGRSPDGVGRRWRWRSPHPDSRSSRGQHHPAPAPGRCAEPQPAARLGQRSSSAWT